jgi:hypothetical protein
MPKLKDRPATHLMKLQGLRLPEIGRYTLDASIDGKHYMMAFTASKNMDLTPPAR